MNRAEQEAYLLEYEVMKKKGKPFFPYAVLKDSVMMMIVALVIVAMSLILGAEQGPKADPTTTTYVPRPEWYFFFLFELLRVIKPPELVPVATIGIPTLCMVLLLLLPFYDRNPGAAPERRPVAMTAGILTIIAMAYLTFLGASAGSPTEIEVEVPPQFETGGKRVRVAAQSGCLACHKFGENGNDGPGPELTEIGAKIPPRRSPARSSPRLGSCPPTGICRRGSSTPWSSSSPRCDEHARPPDDGHGATGGLRRADPRHVRPHRRRLRPDEQRDDRRPASSLARARRRPRRAGGGRLGARRLLRHR